MTQKERLKAIKKVVTPLVKAGENTRKILEAVNSAGIKNKNGNDYTLDAITHLLSSNRIINEKNLIRVRARKRVKTSGNALSASKDSMALKSLILHSDLSDRAKVELLKTLEARS